MDLPQVGEERIREPLYAKTKSTLPSQVKLGDTKMDLRSWFSPPRARKGWRPPARSTNCETESDDSQSGEAPSPPLPRQLDQALNLLRSILDNCDDFTVRELTLGVRKIKAAVTYIEGLVDSPLVIEGILQALVADVREGPAGAYDDSQKAFQRVKDVALSVGGVNTETDTRELVLALLSGQCGILVNGQAEALTADVRSLPRRAISEPSTESIIRGPREGFVELLRVNTGLVRKHVNSPDLKLKQLRLGKRGHNVIAVMYMAGIANPGLVEEVFRRLRSIDIDSVYESGYVEQLIEDDWLSLFPQIDATERPDAVAARLLEGKVAIFTANTPVALVVPATLDSLMHSPEDYYQRWQVASSVRFLRFAATLLALVLPSLYIALTSYHVEMIPTLLALAIGATRQAVPFPAFVEAFMMEGALELLREAGVRLPSPIGQTIGIVGGLVIGEAAVRANLVSPAMVITVALTAISSFAIPNYAAAMAFRLARFFLMILSSILGLYGLMLGLLAILAHLSALKSFGVSYLAPWAPLDLKDMKDTLVRPPLPTLKRRPSFLRTGDHVRMEDKREDGPSQGGEWG